MLAVLETLEYIEKLTGLRISYDKTCIYRIGSIKNTNAKIYTLKPLQWSDGDINMLGATITNGPRQNNDVSASIEKLKNVSSVWYYRTLTVMGKVLIISTLMCSLFTYQMSVLPLLSLNQLQQIDKIISSFLWKGGKAKIPYKVLQNKKEKGGLNLCNLEWRQKSSHLQWIAKLKDYPEMANYATMNSWTQRLGN